MNRKQRRLGAALLAVSMLLAACGTDSEDAAADLPTLAADDASAANGDEATQSGGEDGSDDDEPSEADQDRAYAEYEACLADLGIDLGSGDDDGNGNSIQEFEIDDSEGTGTTPEEMDEAFAECDSILDDAFGSFELSPEQEAEMADQMLEMQRCMADRGFDFDLEGDGGSGVMELDPDSDFEAFEQAMSDCGGEAGLEDGGGDR